MITLTVREIFDLAQCAGFRVEKTDVDDLDVEITIIRTEDIVNGDLKYYNHLAYYTELPEEGYYPLGDRVIKDHP